MFLNPTAGPDLLPKYGMMINVIIKGISVPDQESARAKKVAKQQ